MGYRKILPPGAFQQVKYHHYLNNYDNYNTCRNGMFDEPQTSENVVRVAHQNIKHATGTHFSSMVKLVWCSA